MFTHIEFMHEMPGYTAVLRRLSRFARVVTFDKRGQGLSDRMTGAPSLEQRMDDVRAIMDAIGSTKAVLFGFSEGCPMSVLFAATYPDRVSHLVLLGSFARSKDRLPDDLWQLRCDEIVQNWGSGDTVKTVAPSQAANAEVIAQIAKFERLSSSPGALRTLLVLNRAIDVTTILPMLQTSTLVLHRTGDARVPVALAVPSRARSPARNTWNIRAAITTIGSARPRRCSAMSRNSSPAIAMVVMPSSTVCLRPCCSPISWISTRSAAVMGDHRWRRLLDDHDQLAQQMVGRHRGHLVKSTGDGILATFDGPGRAVRCALAFGSAARQIGLPVRAGLHTGEIEVRGADIGGIAVHAAARVMSQCGSNEVLVSRVVTDLVAGAGLKFAERGAFELKGLPGTWELFAASG
ncbi:adenylate/guanylate cyclase domain-containing protein [Bradyrhizobium sp. 13971]